jgi:TRAP-type C4-dicarboxylate transport system permease small subunit
MTLMQRGDINSMKKFVDHFEEYVIAVLICGMIVFEAINAFMGAFGAAAHGIPEEFALYCYVWLVFLSAAFCAKKGCDVTVSMLVEKYGVGLQRTLKIINNVINIVLNACLLVGAFGLVARTAEAGTVGKLSGFPMVIVYVSSILGFALCVVRNIQKLAVTIKEPAVK